MRVCVSGSIFATYWGDTVEAHLYAVGKPYCDGVSGVKDIASPPSRPAEQLTPSAATVTPLKPLIFLEPPLARILKPSDECISQMLLLCQIHNLSII